MLHTPLRLLFPASLPDRKLGRVTRSLTGYCTSNSFESAMRPQILALDSVER
jgi:hypothetical protein